VERDHTVCSYDKDGCFVPYSDYSDLFGDRTTQVEKTWVVRFKFQAENAEEFGGGVASMIANFEFTIMASSQAKALATAMRTIAASDYVSEYRLVHVTVEPK
jgi:hypothetical protein